MYLKEFGETFGWAIDEGSRSLRHGRARELRDNNEKKNDYEWLMNSFLDWIQEVDQKEIGQKMHMPKGGRWLTKRYARDFFKHADDADSIGDLRWNDSLKTLLAIVYSVTANIQPDLLGDMTVRECVEKKLGPLLDSIESVDSVVGREDVSRRTQLSVVINLIVSLVTENKKNGVMQFWRLLIYATTNILREYPDKDSYDLVDLDNLKIYTCVFILFFRIDGRKYPECIALANSRVLNYICNNPEHKLAGVASLRVAKASLNQEFPMAVTSALRKLARVALHQGDLQLSYDTICTWMKRKSIGIIGEENLIRIPMERRNYDDSYFFYGDMFAKLLALTCVRMADCYEINSAKRDSFLQHAAETLEKCNPKKSIDYVRVVLRQITDAILSISNANLNEYDRLITTLDSLTDICVALISDKNSISYLLADNVDTYLQCARLKEVVIYLARQYCRKTVDGKEAKYEKDIKDHRIKVSEFSRQVLRKNANLLSDSGNNLALWKALNRYGDATIRVSRNEADLCWIINTVSWLILQSLRRYEYLTPVYDDRGLGPDQPSAFRNGESSEKKKNTDKVIAYYTTLTNFMFLFDEMEKPKKPGPPKKVTDDRKGVNCFTIMHARYMNDPNEGVSLISTMKAQYLFGGKQPGYYREELFENQHLFLKSFTDQIDKLHMWNRYASDYDSEGRSSNGCCVVVDPSTFEEAIHKDNSGNDDYRLYRVIYVSGEGEIRLEDNEGINSMTCELFRCLKEMIGELNLLVKSKTSERREAIAKEIITASFGRLMFLCKDNAYADEHESRIIISKELCDSDIQILPTALPQKLAVNPFFQVYVDNVVLGPNVKYPDDWKPLLQYKLSSMWKKKQEAKDYGNKTANSTEKRRVNKSSIPYTSK